MKQFKISAIVVGIGLLFMLALTFMFGLSNTDTNTDELERQALVAEGKSITAEMEQANRNQDWSRMAEIRERDATFKRRASRYLARHAQTPPP